MSCLCKPCIAKLSCGCSVSHPYREHHSKLISYWDFLCLSWTSVVQLIWNESVYNLSSILAFSDWKIGAMDLKGPFYGRSYFHDLESWNFQILFWTLNDRFCGQSLQMKFPALQHCSIYWELSNCSKITSVGVPTRKLCLLQVDIYSDHHSTKWMPCQPPLFTRGASDVWTFKKILGSAKL